MNDLRELAAQMASLSVFKGILNRPVPRAFYKLLWAANGEKEAFLHAWGDFFAALCDAGFSDNFAGALSDAALYDENAFSVAASAGKTPAAPVCAAAKRDLQILCRAGSVTPQALAAASAYPDLLEILALPLWQVGSFAQQMQGDETAILTKVQAFLEQNGCGMYARYHAFIWRGKELRPVAHPEETTFADLKGYELPRGLAVRNTEAFLEGLPANNCLLYGDRGTGKSSTVKALLNEYWKQGLRVIEIPKESLMDFPFIVEQIAEVPLKFLLFIDDLSFSRQDDTYAALKAVLEGGLAPRPKNALIYATSNRRHLLRETFSDREGDEIHRGDTIQESLSLADRFGLSINFSLPDKLRYLEIVQQLAHQRGLQEYIPELEIGAERWAMARGGRSPRCAKQYMDDAEAKARRGEPLL